MKAIKYARNPKDLAAHMDNLKMVRCPICGRTGYLNRHGCLKGYSDSGQDKDERGKRVFCSNRNCRAGCGRTYSILLAYNLFRRMLNTLQLWAFISLISDGSSIKSAWQQTCKLALETAYSTWTSFRKNQSHIRSRLSRHSAAPKAIHAGSAINHLIAHLKDSFIGKKDPIGEFQASFQVPFLR